MIISKVVIWFFMYSAAGWIYEVVYSTITTRHWDNRGFLYAPICPIYGFGAVSCVLLLQRFNIWQIFILGVLGSAILEYVTAWALERLFHALWWDYSKVPLNINGYICLPASLGFGAAAVLIIKVLHPYVLMATGVLTSGMQEFLALMLVAVFASDMTLTVSSLTSIEKKLAEFEASIDAFMEEKYDRIGYSIGEKLAGVRSKVTLSIEEERFMINNLKKLKLHFSTNELMSIGRIKKYTNDKYNIFRKRIEEINISDKKHKSKAEYHKISTNADNTTTESK